MRESLKQIQNTRKAMFKRPLYCIDKVIKSFKCNNGFLIFPSWHFVAAILSLKGSKSSLRAWFEFSEREKRKKRKNFQKHGRK